ncbi:MAG: M20/M25/M40 family metallo-hydrolase [Bacteroidota bacterium]
MELLQRLIDVHAPSGEEFRMTQFLLDYLKKESKKWKYKPQIISGDNLHDSLILVFGKPRTAVFAHMDSIGFTTRYENQLVPIGGPHVEEDILLSGEDSLGPIECKLKVDEEHRLFHDFPRAIDRGTSLVFKPSLNVTKNYVEGTYLDNRLGMYNALKVAETMKDGAIVFSCYEEHGGGSVPMLTKFLYEEYKIKQALISDITWVTEGVTHGNGVAISLRDRNIPRKVFLNKILELANESGISFQLEVEGAGSSDGKEVHHSLYPIDWCFIGAPEANVHSPKEKVHIDDIQSMIEMYRYLIARL